MKQKGLCRALLLILFATCAVAGLALGFGEGCGCRKGESGDKAVCIGSDAGEGRRTVGLIGHVGGRYGTMDFSPLSSSIVPGRYRGLFPGKLLWWILGLMGTA